MEGKLMVEEFWLMLREVELSRTSVPLSLVVDLVHLELPVRRLLARRNNINNNKKEECPAPRSQEPVKIVRNLVTGERKGNTTGNGVGKGNAITRVVSMKMMAEDSVRERRSISGVDLSKDEVSQRKVMATMKGVGVQTITSSMSVRRNKGGGGVTVTVMIEWRKINTVMMIASISGQTDPSRVSIDLIFS